MIITLLTDFGLDDNFVGVVKGVILGINPKVKIVDISHSVMPGNIFQAAFLLKSSYLYFPFGTVHLVVVDPGVGSGRKAIIAKTAKYYFVGPDNDVLSLAPQQEEKIINIVSITNQRFFLKPVSFTFHGRDIFAPIVAYLACGRKITEFGTSQGRTYKHLRFPQPKIIPRQQYPAINGKKNKTLQGEIIYIDHFGNLITNIQEDVFKGFVGGGNFRICLKEKTINKINKSYLEAEKNKPIAIFSSFGNLEISIGLGNARDYFGARRGLKVVVIKEKKK